MSGRVEGKVVLVTGAARGQGRAHALAYADEGASVVAMDLCGPIKGIDHVPASGADDLARTVDDVRARGAKVVGVQADARSSEQMREVVDRTLAELGRLDVLVANHGVSAALPWDQQTDATWDAVIEGNLSSVWRVTRAVIPPMVAQGGGSIIFISSIAAARGHVNLSAHSASKAGLLGLMRSLSAELAPHSINVNAILPSTCAGDMLRDPGTVERLAGRAGASAEELRFGAASMSLLDIPWVEPEDIAKAALFLGSDEARYVTGISIPVDGGALIQPPGVPPSAAGLVGALDHAERLAGGA